MRLIYDEFCWFLRKKHTFFTIKYDEQCVFISNIIRYWNGSTQDFPYFTNVGIFLEIRGIIFWIQTSTPWREGSSNPLNRILHSKGLDSSFIIMYESNLDKPLLPIINSLTKTNPQVYFLYIVIGKISPNTSDDFISGISFNAYLRLEWAIP